MFLKGELICFWFFISLSDILPESEKQRDVTVTAEVSPDLDEESVCTCV